MFMKRAVALFLLFLRPAGLDFASGTAGLVGGLLGMSNSQSIPHANFNAFGNGLQWDAAWNQAMQSMQSNVDRNTGMVDPEILKSWSQLLGIDPSILATAGGVAGNQYAGLSDLSQIYGGQLGQQAGQQFAAGADIYNLGRDPQNQLHDYVRSQVIDSARGADSARGIGMSPYSAGNEADAARKFEMDWQNQQLGRGLAGLQGMNQANTLGGMDLSNSMALYANAPAFTLESANAPIQGQVASGSFPMQMASMFTGAENANVLQPQAALQGQYFPYMGANLQEQMGQFEGNMNSVLARNAMQQQSVYGLAGGGQNQGGNPYGNWGGNQSGFGNPMNWMGMGGMGGGG